MTLLLDRVCLTTAMYNVDDTQLYIAIEHSANLHSELLRMERCVAGIRNWIRHNMLKLNDNKTELIVFASRYNQHLYSDVSMMIGNTTVVCESQVKNLGVIFDLVSEPNPLRPLRDLQYGLGEMVFGGGRHLEYMNI